MKHRISAFLSVVFLSVSTSAWAQTLGAQNTGTQSPAEYYGHEMMWGGGGWGWAGMIVGPIMMIAVLAIIIAVVVLIVRWLGGGCPSAHGRGHRSQDMALAILKERFAKGEIDQKEFEEKRRILED